MKGYEFTVTQVQLAVSLVNIKYNGNLKLTKCKDVSNSRHTITDFTIKPVSSVDGDRVKLGARWNADRTRRVSSCCWHVWYDVLSKLFELNPKARITGAMYSCCIKDFEIKARICRIRNIGSIWAPSLYIDACDC